MKFKSQFNEDEEINMAPMIDMVFLLLIFFMVASHMIKIDKTPVELPAASSSVVPEQISDRTFITIRSIDSFGEKVEYFMTPNTLDNCYVPSVEKIKKELNVVQNISLENSIKKTFLYHKFKKKLYFKNVFN